jgi:hypothetical protein
MYADASSGLCGAYWGGLGLPKHLRRVVRQAGAGAARTYTAIVQTKALPERQAPCAKALHVQYLGEVL